MKNKLGTFRDWHLWVGVVSAIPILIIAVSTIFLVHKELNFRISLPSWGADAMYSSKSKEKMVPALRELRSVLATDQGLWLASKSGLSFVDASGSLRAISVVGEVRDLHLTTDRSVLAAGKNGLWRLREDGEHERLIAEEVRTISANGGFLAVTGKRSWWHSEDGGASWLNGATLGEKDLRAVLVRGKDELWVAGKEGVHRILGGQLQPLEGSERLKVRDMEGMPDGAVLLVTEDAVLRWTPEGLAQMQRGDKFASVGSTLEMVFVAGRNGAFQSVDQGQRWSEWMIPAELQTSVMMDRQAVLNAYEDRKEKEKGGVEIRKVMKDLHTGKFLGDYKWLWGDLTAASLILFVFSGVWLWWKARRRALQQIQDTN